MPIRDFNALATAFDLHNAAMLARVAELVYDEADGVGRALRAECGLAVEDFLDVDETQCLVASNRDMLLVAFRGTEPDSLADWITDSQMDLVAGPLGGRVHAGFYEALSHVWRSVEQWVLAKDPENRKPLWVTGHSLGGALATLAVARWLDAARPVAGLYTFGQPRTGDREFARNFNFLFKPHAFRVVNNDDLVTRAPPRAFGYSHQGTFKYFDADGQFQEGIEWWNLFLDRWKGRLERILLSDDSGSDHSMTIYREHIENALRTAEPASIHVDQTGTPSLAGLIRPRRRAA